MILHIENPKNTTRKLLDLINEFGKVAGYKTNTQKPVVFLYTNNERLKDEWRDVTYLNSKTCFKTKSRKKRCRIGIRRMDR